MLIIWSSGVTHGTIVLKIFEDKEPVIWIIFKDLILIHKILKSTEY